MTSTALLLPAQVDSRPEPIDLRLAELRQMVLDSVVAENSKRNYAKALDDLFLFAASRPLTRALLMEWRVAMNKLSPSTVNVRLSAMRKLVTEALLGVLRRDSSHDSLCRDACLRCLLTQDSQDAYASGLLDRRSVLEILGGLALSPPQVV